MAVEYQAPGGTTGRVPTRAARNHGSWRRVAGRPPPLPSPRSPQRESGAQRAQQRRALDNLWIVTTRPRSSWIGDGADRVIEEGLPLSPVVLPGTALATDHDHRLCLG